MTLGKIFQITVISLVILSTTRLTLVSQEQTSEVLQTGTLKEQMDHVQARTIIYNNFRAIREDMFQTIKKNSLDSLDSAKRNIDDLEALLNTRSNEITSLESVLTETRADLTSAIDNRDNIMFLGMHMNKLGYNLFVWTIIGALSVLLLIVLVLFNRNRIVTDNTLNEFEDLRNEFEAYKITSREKREQLVMEHFHEIKKLKEG